MDAVVTSEQVREVLSSVVDPERGQSVVDLGIVRSVDVADDGRVAVVLAVGAPGSPIRAQYEGVIRDRVGALHGVSSVTVGFDLPSAEEKEALGKRGQKGGLPEGALAGVKNVICVASGKGGVGKSTLTANLAAALAAEGKRAAALDADVWGYSIPRMLGVHGRPTVNADRKINPLEAAAGVKVMSIEFFLEAQDQAIVWRGPMLHKAIKQFLQDVEWGEVDFLVLDLPPGTGDVSMTLAQLIPNARMVIVTTPQPAAQKVAHRASELARRFDLEIAGVIENMSGFTTPSGERFTIFGEGGGQLLADELDVPLLAKIPLQESLRVGADEGRPLVLDDPHAPASQSIRQAARGLIAMAPIPAFEVPPAAPASSGRRSALPTAGAQKPPAESPDAAPPPEQGPKVTGTPLSLPLSR
jgi:ATP-binding protein involved in chromosome partitioning